MNSCRLHTGFNGRCLRCIWRMAVSPAHRRELDTCRRILLGYDVKTRQAESKNREKAKANARKERLEYEALLGTLKRLKGGNGARSYCSAPVFTGCIRKTPKQSLYSPLGSTLGPQR